jgi:hypothetical protein
MKRYVRWFVDENFPIASRSKIGGVRPDGVTTTVDPDGTIHGIDQYVLPPATTEVLGGVIVDGTTIYVGSDGKLHGNDIKISHDESNAIKLDENGCLVLRHMVADDEYIDTYTKDDDGDSPMFIGGEPLTTISIRAIRSLWQNMKEYVEGQMSSFDLESEFSIRNYVESNDLYRILGNVLKTVTIIDAFTIPGNTTADDGTPLEYMHAFYTYDDMPMQYEYALVCDGKCYFDVPTTYGDGTVLEFNMPDGEKTRIEISDSSSDSSKVLTLSCTDGKSHRISLERFVALGTADLNNNVGGVGFLVRNDYASATYPGSVRVGSGLKIDSNGVLSVDMDELFSQYEDAGNVWVDNDVVNDINSAIKSMTGSTSDYDPEDMPSAILGITSSPSLGTKTITTNGTHRASSDGLDGYSVVTINVTSA